MQIILASSDLSMWMRERKLRQRGGVRRQSSAPEKRRVF
jgi:hypothetical protein